RPEPGPPCLIVLSPLRLGRRHCAAAVYKYVLRHVSTSWIRRWRTVQARHYLYDDRFEVEIDKTPHPNLLAMGEGNQRQIGWCHAASRRTGSDRVTGPLRLPGRCGLDWFGELGYPAAGRDHADHRGDLCRLDPRAEHWPGHPGGGGRCHPG